MGREYLCSLEIYAMRCHFGQYEAFTLSRSKVNPTYLYTDKYYSHQVRAKSLQASCPCHQHPDRVCLRPR